MSFFTFERRKDCYKSNSHPCKASLMDKFFTIRKGNSMDEYLMDMKEAVDTAMGPHLTTIVQLIDNKGTQVIKVI